MDIPVHKAHDGQQRGPAAGSHGYADGLPAAPTSVGVLQALAWCARRNRAFFIAAAIYAVGVLIAMAAGVIHGDVLVSSAIYFILVIGLDLLYGCAGMLSFAHVGFFAVGAYAVAVLTVTYGLDPWLALLCGMAINLVLSVILGRICLRLSGSYFMLGSLAFGIMVHAVITVGYSVTGGDAGLGGIPRPTIAGVQMTSDATFGTMVWVLAALLFWFTLTLSRSRAGRALRALGSDETAAACAGVHVDRLKTNVFALSAAYASLAGSLFAMYNGAVHPDSFSLGVLLNVLLMLFLGGTGTIWGGLIGATFISALPDLSGPLMAAKDLFNGILFSVIIILFPQGIAGAMTRFTGRKGEAATEAGPSHCMPLPHLSTDAAHAPVAGPSLRLQGLSKRFGGVQAVDGVSFDVQAGSIKALIGPNGAGKSTMMNLISGVAQRDTGAVLLGGHDLRGLRPDQVARAGIQRTFQHERLFSQLDVTENVMVGHERGIGGSPLELLACGLGLPSTVAAEIDARRAAQAWVAALGLSAHAARPVDELPTGLRKLVEVARACAAGPAVLLLDETAAGLNNTERLAFIDLVRRLSERGMAIVLIEHDIDLVMELSDEVCVINFGRRIADGSPQAVRSNEEVVAAYLGT
jgi:ABC-type branched-subunit amino acid transport system ATPase component/ABC-type branched-subunit amino acid transport system permease subunit